MSRKPPSAAMIPRAILRIDFTAASPVRRSATASACSAAFACRLFDQRAAALVAGEGLQFGEEAGDVAGERDRGVALLRSTSGEGSASASFSASCSASPPSVFAITRA